MVAYIYSLAQLLLREVLSARSNIYVRPHEYMLVVLALSM